MLIMAFPTFKRIRSNKKEAALICRYYSKRAVLIIVLLDLPKKAEG